MAGNKIEIQIVGNNVYAVNAIDGTKNKLGKLKTAADSTESSLSRLGKGLVAGLTVGGAIGFMQSSIQAFREQEVAIKKLDTALGKNSLTLQQYASELQKTTVYGDETTLQAMSLLAAFVKDEEQIKKLTQATMDLASAKGMDLVSAADLVAKSVGSSTNALSRYGIKVDGAVGSTQRLESAVKSISTLYGGQATAEGKTLSGQLDILNNQLNDQQEIIGEGLLPVWVALNQAGAGLIGVFKELSGFTFGKQLAEQEQKRLQEFKKQAQERYDLLSKTFNLVQDTGKPMILLTEEQKKALEIAEKHRIEESKKYELLRKQNEERKKEIDFMLSSLIDSQQLDEDGMFEPLRNVGVTAVEMFGVAGQAGANYTSFQLAQFALLEESTVGIFSNMAGAALNFYDASGSAAKGWFGVYKAMAITQTAIATYQAAVEAYKSMVGIPIVGPGLAVAAAAAATAFGLSNIARISSMQPGGGFGGGVPSAAPSLPANSTTNNIQRSITQNITIVGSVRQEDKDRIAREFLDAIRKANEDGA